MVLGTFGTIARKPLILLTFSGTKSGTKQGTKRQKGTKLKTKRRGFNGYCGKSRKKKSGLCEFTKE